MPNEVTSLLNALNSYITCPVCKVTNEIEIILKCGHLICKSCKTKRTKCPLCYCDLSVTKPHSPSIKFIKELHEELWKASKGKIKCVESELVANPVGNPNVKEQNKRIKETRKSSETTNSCPDNIKNNINFVSKEDIEINNDGGIKVIDEINTFRKEDNIRKNYKNKKDIVFYRNYYKQKKERKVYENILNGFGIVGIDKQIENFKSEHCLNISEMEWNGQLNTIISRLNDQHPENDDLENTKLKYSLKMYNDNDNSDSDQEIKKKFKTSMNSPTKNGLNIIKTNIPLKRKTADISIDYSNGTNDDCKAFHSKTGFDVISTHGGLKRKKMDTATEKSPCGELSVKNTDIMGDCIEVAAIDLVNLDKKLGGIVDETEIVQRYSNSFMEEVGKEEIIGKTKQCNNLEKTIECFEQKQFKVSNEEPPSTDKTITDDKKCERLSKSVVMNIVSDLMEEIKPKSEEDGLRSDIMADMLHNVYNEIIVVGNSLCAAEEITGNTSVNGSCNVSNNKNNSTMMSLLPEIPLAKNKTRGISGRSDIIVVSDSEDEVEVVKEYSISDPSCTKANQTDIHSEDINIKNCSIVIENFAPLMLQSAENNISITKDECLRNSNVRKSVSIDNVSTGNSPKKKGKMDLDDQNIFENHEINFMQTSPKQSSEQKTNRCKEVVNNFEGFTEQDILVPTVKLALFKMNCKYLKHLSSSSLYTLGGKHILIKDVSHEEEKYTGSPNYPNKISKSLVSSSVQTENELVAVTPSPGTSKLRPVSLDKLCGFEIEHQRFMQNDVLEIRKATTPNTPFEKESVASTLSQNSPVPVHRTTPVSRRQLSFVSPSFEQDLKCQYDGASTSNAKAIESMPSSSSNEDWQMLHYRMQHIIPSSSDGALHNEFERSGIRPTRLTFTTCSLNSKETALVTKLAQMTKSCLTKDFTHNTTHLIIGANGRGTLEYYLAIAYRAFIVTMEWVTLCLALNKVLPVTGFIPTEDEGPLKCLEPIGRPFMGFYVYSHILPSASKYPIAEITKTLLSLGGAKLLSSLDVFHTLQDGQYPRFFIYSSPSQITQAVTDKCTNLQIVPVEITWVYESIGAFRALPIMDFLGVVIHSRTLIRDYKIPEQLACSRYPRLEGEFHPQILDERYQRSL